MKGANKQETVTCFERKNTENEKELIFKKIIEYNFPELREDKSPLILKYYMYSMNKSSTPRNGIVIFQNIEVKEKYF